MEKRFFLFLALSLLVLFVYSSQVQQQDLQKGAKPPAEQEGMGPPWDKPQGGKVEQPGRRRLAEARPGKKAEKREGKDVVVETDLYRLVLTTSGARIKSYCLKKYEEMKVAEGSLDRDLSSIEGQLRKEKRAGARRRLVRERDRLKYLIERERLPLEGVELVPFDGPVYGNYPLTLTSPAIDEDGELNFALYQSSRDGLRLDRGQESGTIEFRYVTPQGIEVKKRFHFSRDSYLIRLEIVIENNSSRAITEESFLIAYGPEIGLIKKAQLRGRQAYPFASWVGGKLTRDIAGKEIGRGFFKKTTMKWDVPKPHPGPVGWTALRNSYFAAALIPEGEVAGAQLLENEDGTREIALKMLPFSIPRGGEACKKLCLYLGPQEIGALRKSGSNLGTIVDFGSLWWIAGPIHTLLRIFHRWFGNYGLSIILLSLTIKLVFYPFTHKSFEAMKKMQEDMKTIHPEIEALKKKHQNNPQKLNKATMELYKRRGVNPLGGCKGGCLPMLFQMPVFFALYAVLYNAIELRQAHFFGWVNDLSSPDPYKVLPILMGVTMFLQQKLTGMGGTSGPAAQPDQAKMMSIMMPIVLTFVFFNMASGVVLYWLCFNVFTIAQQFLVRKKTAD